MEADDCAQVCWIFADEDAAIARELLSRAKGLESLGVVQNATLTSAALATLSRMPDPIQRQRR